MRRLAERPANLVFFGAGADLQEVAPTGSADGPTATPRVTVGPFPISGLPVLAKCLSFKAMTTSQVRRDGGHIAYEAQGEGPLVVLAHGMGENRATFRHLVPLLVAAGHRVASVDVRGHGESSAGWPTYAPAEVGADLLAVVRDLDAGPAVLVGSSSAAAAVVFAATDAPELVTGIVQIGAFVGQPKLNPLLRMAMWSVLHSPRLFGMFHKTLFPVHRPADDASYRRAMVANLREPPGRMAATRGVVAPPSRTGPPAPRRCGNRCWC